MSFDEDIDVQDLNISDEIVDAVQCEKDKRIAELQTLLDSSLSIDFDTLRSAAGGRPLSDAVRAPCWQVFLGIANRSDPFTHFDELFNLPQQSLIRQRCSEIVDALGNDNSDRAALTYTLESVITLFCRERGVKFVDKNGWMDILQLLCVLGVNKAQMYHMFNAIVMKYVPHDCSPNGKSFDLFRLLLLYHEPALCSFLDTRKITPDMYAERWFSTIFSSVADVNCTLPLWDVYLQQGDPFAVFFMALVMLINGKEVIMSQSADESGREEIIKTIASIPSQLSANDIEDFCQLATYYSRRTPQSFRRDYHGPLYGSNLVENEFTDSSVHSLLCLPVSVQELLTAQKAAHIREADSSDDIHYFVIDARPTVDFMHGHLPGAFNLDASLMVNSPDDYTAAMGTLIEYKQRSWPNAHYCFMGCGGEENADTDQYIYMVISAWLQKHMAYVSLARGGYSALHDVLRESLSTRLKSHSTRSCRVCVHQARRHSTTSPQSMSPAHEKMMKASSPVHRAYNPDLQSSSTHHDQHNSNNHNNLSSLVGRLKQSSITRSIIDVKDKVIDYVVNPMGEYDDAIKHVSESQRHSGRSYRNVASVFSIDDDNDNDEQQQQHDFVGENNNFDARKERAQQKRHTETPSTEPPVQVNLIDWMRDNDLNADTCFDGEYVETDTKLLRPCRVAVTDAHLYVLYPCKRRKISENEQQSDTKASTTTAAENLHEIFAKRPLATIHKITSKKTMPELLTIKYGYVQNNGEYKITRVDKLLVPKSGDLAKALKTAVCNMREAV